MPVRDRLNVGIRQKRTPTGEGVNNWLWSTLEVGRWDKSAASCPAVYDDNQRDRRFNRLPSLPRKRPK